MANAEDHLIEVLQRKDRERLRSASLRLASSAGNTAAGTIRRPHVRRAARVMESAPAQRVQGPPFGAAPVDVLTGFLSERGDAYGRPVGVAVDHRGARLVADDVGNVIRRVSAVP